MTNALLFSELFSEELSKKLALINCHYLSHGISQQVMHQQVMGHSRENVTENHGIVTAAMAQTKQTLQHFAQDPARFATVMAEVFGGSADLVKQERLRQQWQGGAWHQGEFALPRVRVLSSSAMGLQVAGAYSKDTATIYLSEALLETQDLYLIRRVLLEEIGHAIDAQLNVIETPGDEGDLFAALVLGESLTPEKIAAIRSEDDHGWVWVDGTQVAVEQAGGVLLRTNVFGDKASNPANLTVIGTTMYFTADDGVNGVELWKTDGTASGTALVA
ncbi:MAG: hypothetical protein WCO45_02675, partial [Pseudanabaena sp. ELA607]